MSPKGFLEFNWWYQIKECELVKSVRQMECIPDSESLLLKLKTF